jgi:glutathione S-transferase
MKLYYFESLNPRKACAVARHLNAPVEYIRIDLTRTEQKTPAFLAINPNGKVPVLEDGARTIWESTAIMCHLSQAMGSDLWPNDARQLDVLRWLTWDLQHFTRHGGQLYFQYIIKPRFGIGGPDTAAVQEALGYFRNNAAVLNDHLRGRSFVVDDRLSVADFALAATLPYASAAHIPVAEFPEIERWHRQLSELPAWRQPFPELRDAA